MPSRVKTIRHLFDGGWATDYGPTAEVGVGQDGFLRIPYLLDAQNVIYEYDGGPHKVGGTSKLNSSALESGATIRGVYDYWRQGASGSPTQKRIVHVSTKVYQDDADGSFSSLFTGLDATAIPSYGTFDDVLIIASDIAADVPKYWDTTTAKNLGTNTPSFSFGCAHKNRWWAAGVAATPSRLFYSPDLVNSGPDGDWDGTTSGYIDIDPGDGDRITGIASHKDDLWVFKGPYKKSIHRIAGSAPTGDDGFSRHTFIQGVSAVYHNSIFKFRDDLGFMDSDGSVHALSAVAAYGDFKEAALNRDIGKWINEHLNNTALKTAWAVTQPALGRTLFTIPIDAATSPNALLSMDYRFAPVRWSYLTFASAFNPASIAPVIDSASSNKHIFMAGCSDGYVRKLDQATRSIDGSTGISAFVATPHLNYGSPKNMKTLFDASISIAPKGSSDITFGVEMDNRAEETYDVSQEGGALLDDFELDVDVLGGARYLDRFVNTEGEFRSISYSFLQSGNSEDMELHGFSAGIKLGAESIES